MKFKLITLLFIILYPIILSASNNSKKVLVHGTIIESLDKYPLPQATIKIMALPDSTFIKGTVSIDKGNFEIEVEPKADLLMCISYLGFDDFYQELQLSENVAKLDLGELEMSESTLLLGEAIVEGHAPEMVLKEDTVEFNADSYKLPPSSMVEDLIKKLPGVDIDADGNITAGGKPIKRILVDGKEFFGDDVAVALQNINVEILSKLQVIDRKSEEARLTGVDDGEDEKVINLTVKEGMKKGWFGTSSAAVGNKNRYELATMTNRFVGDNQFSILGGINNINNRGLSDSGSQIQSGSNTSSHGGLSTYAQLGTNFSYYNNEVLRINGNVMATGSEQYQLRNTDRENILANSSTYYTQDYKYNSRAGGVSSNFRIRWRIDSLTNLTVTPVFKVNKYNYDSFNDFQTIREDSSNINNGFEQRESERMAYNYNIQATLVRSSKYKKGRKGSVSFTFYGNNVDGDLYSDSETFYGDSLLKPEDYNVKILDQWQKDNNDKLGYRTRLTYIEPLSDGKFLQFAYTLHHSNTTSKRYTYNWDDATNAYETDFDSIYSDDVRNEVLTQNLNVNFRHVKAKYNYTVGFNMDPSYTKSINVFDEDRSFVRNTINWGPTANLIYLWSKHNNIRLQYRGRTQEPSISQLQPSKNVTNPLNIREGNLDLSPSYINMYSVNYSLYKPESQRSVYASLQGKFVNNSIVNKTTYDDETGVRTTKPINVNGVWDINGALNTHIPLKDKRFKFNNNVRTSYAQQVGFTNELKNLARTLTVREKVSFRFSNDDISLETRGNYTYSRTQNTISSTKDNEVMEYGGTFTALYYLPFDLTLGTDFTYLGKSGYTSNINPNEFLWNLQANYEFLKNKRASLYFRYYDLLQQQTAVRRRVTADYIEDTTINSLTSYFMIGFVYRLNTMGKG